MNSIRAVCFACTLMACACLFAVHAAEPAAPVEASGAGVQDPAAFAARIAKEVAEIRGLPFKRRVGVEIQKPEEFGKYLDENLDEAVPDELVRHYGNIVNKLGLYRGPEIEDFRLAMKGVLSSQAGAYYDPHKQRFYVLIDELPEAMAGVLYAHELYHGLQDQYFGLDKYIRAVGQRGKASFDSDHALARQSVIEGEATYVMTLWTVKRMTQTVPGRQMLAPVIAIQSSASMDQIAAMLEQPQVAAAVGDKARESVNSAKNIPPFIMETLIGAYLKGLAFVFAVHEQGWPAVEKLYTEYPPQSTEHILHPEKWVAREAPSTIEWPAFERVDALRNWELLDADVLGEFQWRIIFKEHGLTAEADAVAAGWDGDRYAVFKRKDSDAMLLLARTSWDSEADAKEFADAYGRLLAIKYQDTRERTRIEHEGVDVLIVEGGSDTETDALMKVVSDARKQRARTVK
jgi:hypothetical protein